jgi:hypothetical protein
MEGHTIDPSPALEATRLIDPERTSPTEEVDGAVAALPQHGALRQRLVGKAPASLLVARSRVPLIAAFGQREYVRAAIPGETA